MTWFHLSYEFLGDDFLFIPRIPLSKSDEEDDVTPRICVSDTYTRCIMGIEGMSMRAIEEDFGNFPRVPFFVYALEGDVYIPDDKQIPDLFRTHERWLLTPTVGKFRHIIKVGSLGLKNLCKKYG